MIFSIEEGRKGNFIKYVLSEDYKRHKDSVGKDMMGKIYFHKNYAYDIIDKDIYDKALSILKDNFPNFTFNCLCYNPKEPNIVRFDEAPDFDTSREPIPGDMIQVNIDDGSCKKSHSNQIWHHKWMWVKDDYSGFDVKASRDWSNKWVDILTKDDDWSYYVKRIGHKKYWNELLKKYNLPIENNLEESLSKLNDEAFITDSEYDIKNLLLNKPKAYRILFDSNIQKYMICDANNMIHLDMLKAAIKDGYYLGLHNDNEIVQEYIDMMNETRGRSGIDNYIEVGIDGYTEDDDGNMDEFGQYLLYMIYIPKGVSQDDVENSPDNDGYDGSTEYDSGTLYTRYAEQPYWFDNCDLFKVLR